jgi:ketosteroid isomerase-like protein
MPSSTSQKLAATERLYELFNALPHDAAERRSSPLVRELLELCHPDLRFTQPSVQPEGGREFEGQEQFLEAWEDWFALWKEHHSQPVEILQDADRVLVLSRERLVARDGVVLDRRGAVILTFRDGRIARIDSFMDHDSARRAFDDEDAV